METALVHYGAGRKEEAEKACQELLALKPDHHEALHFLGMLAYQSENATLAIDYISRAVAANPSEHVYLCNLALVQIKGGSFEDALESCRVALEINPGFFDAHNNKGEALMGLNLMEEATGSFREAIRLNPDFVHPHNNLGNALKAMGRLQEAVESLRQGIRLNPEIAEIHHNLGLSLKESGQLDEAIVSFREALRLNPNYIEANHNIGVILWDQEKASEAEEIFREVLRQQPDHFDAHYNLAQALFHKNQIKEAMACCQEAVRLKPKFTEAHILMANMLQNQARTDEAVSSYDRAIDSLPDNPLLKLIKSTICPPIMMDVQEIDRCRSQLEKTINELSLQTNQLELRDIQQWAKEPPFFFAYHGRNDLEIRSKYADLFANSFPCHQPPASSGTPRIGVVVTDKHEGIFLRTFGRVLNNLSQEKMKISIICTEKARTTISNKIHAQISDYCIIPFDFCKAAEIIRERAFDLLYYYEAGSGSLNYFLPFFRLAPVQCTSHGFPVTSGIPNMDYFISSKMAEIDNAQAHYREELYLIDSLPSYYRPDLPSPLKDRTHFGLDSSDNIYSCFQNLLKFHPDFDTILNEILRQDPKGILLLVDTSSGKRSEMLMSRFEKSIPDGIDRIRILPGMPREDLLNLISLCDVALDPIHYNGGNTAFETFTMGTPLVTMPDKFLRGRYLYGIYRKMGVMDCVASSPEEYVDLSIRFGTDPTQRALVKEKILATYQVLTDDIEVPGEHEKFFLWAIEKARAEHA